MAEDEQRIGHAVDHRRQFYESLCNGGETCFVCWDTYEAAGVVVYPGTCRVHFLHSHCYRKLLKTDLRCPICRNPYDVTGRNDVFVFVCSTLPLRVDNPSTMIEIPPGIRVDEVDTLIGRRVPCCAYPFTDEDFAVFPDPCVTHPVHSICYLIDRLGDRTQTDLRRAIYCPYLQCRMQYHEVNIVCRPVRNYLNLYLEESFGEDFEGEDFMFDLD